MSTQSFTQSDGRVVTVYSDDATQLLSFKVTAADGTELVTKTAISGRMSGSGVSEDFGGVNITPSGGFVFLYNSSENFSRQDYIRNFDANGVALGDGVAITGNGADLVPSSNSAQWLSLANGNMAIYTSGTLIISDQDGALSSFNASSGGAVEGSIVEIGGNIVAFRTRRNPDGDDDITEMGVFGQDSTLITPFFQISEGTHKSQSVFGLGIHSVDSIALGDGRLVVAYSDFLTENDTITNDRQSVFVKVLNADGSTDVPEFLASPNNADGDSIQPQLFTLNDGGFALIYHTTMGFPRVARTELRVYNSAGEQTALLDLTAGGQFPEEILVMPDGLILSVANGDHTELGDLDVGGPASVTLIGDDGSDTLTGGAGDDVVDGRKGGDDLFGGNGDDTVIGNQGRDLVHGDAGEDILIGGAGDDTIFGGTGNDDADGGSGSDVIFGGSGDDTLAGKAGTDTIEGGSGNDILRGAGGDDVLTGDEGDDILFGGGNKDTLYGGDGDDTLEGAATADALYGGADGDLLKGGNGDDILDGGVGDDVMNGGKGRDQFTGGAGNDTMTGGVANDDFIFADGFGEDVITDFNANAPGEEIDLSGVTNITDFADLAANHMAQVGADVVITDGADTITLQGVNLAKLDVEDFLF